jgi:hypothetical protein
MVRNERHPHPSGGVEEENMNQYHHREISFAAPQGWVDRSMVAFSAPKLKDEPPTGTNIVMSREPLPPGDTLRTHADRQLLAMGRTLEDFQIVESRELQVGGHNAILFRFRWRSVVAVLEQSMVLVESGTVPESCVTTFTSTARDQEAAEMRTVFAETLETVRFGATPPPEDFSAPPSSHASEDPISIMIEVPDVPMPGSRRRR